MDDRNQFLIHVFNLVSVHQSNDSATSSNDTCGISHPPQWACAIFRTDSLTDSGAEILGLDRIARAFVVESLARKLQVTRGFSRLPLGTAQRTLNQ